MHSALRIITVYLLLLVAAPAGANTLEDALCRAPSVPVAQMPSSEKLCRAFVLGMAQMPQATGRELQALLTPENLATMASLSAIWAGSQGVPVVGEAVDLALVSLGVVLLAVEAADVTHALWDYARLSTRAQNTEELKAAGAHLARAVVLAGINVVTFVLTNKAVTRIKRQPPAQPSLKPATPPGTPDAPAVPPLAVNESRARSPLPGGNRAGKLLDLEAFANWVAAARKRTIQSRTPSLEYQSRKAGTEEVLLKGGGEQVWADGIRASDAYVLETKFVETPGNSPFIEGSKCNDGVRAAIREQEVDQFTRYAAILGDPRTPAVGLEVITNDIRALPYFESLMSQLGIPGRVVVDP